MNSRRECMNSHQLTKKLYDEQKHFLLLKLPKECDLLSFWINQSEQYLFLSNPKILPCDPEKSCC